MGLGNLIDRSLAGVRMSAGLEVQHHLVSLSARDLPGIGCLFTIDLPRHYMLEAVPVAGTA